MKVTIGYIEKKFDEFNRRMFAGRLPRVPVELANATSFLGQIVYRQERGADGCQSYCDFRLRISERREYSEDVLDDTIIHEMIHLLILWNGLHDTSTHGAIFKSVMESINAAYGRHVTVRHRATEEERQAVAESVGHKWHVIAAIYFADGRVGLKVLPRTVQRVLYYHRAVAAHPTVREVRLYLHNNRFFNRYPASSALRVHDIDREVLESNLYGARRLTVQGSSLV